MKPFSLHELSFAIIPGTCRICGAAGDRHRDLCAHCAARLPWMPPGCPRCGQPNIPESGCGACQQHPLPWRRGHFAFLYESPITGLHRAFKFHRDLGAGFLLGKMLAEYLRDRSDATSSESLLMPIPLHWRRHLVRGFNQAEVITRLLGRYLNLPVSSALHRCRHTAAQHALDRTERHENVHEVFRVTASVEQRTILLVDDVITTGATAASATRTLLKAGARHVDICCLARALN